MGNKTANGVIKSINDKLEAFVDAKLQGEKYAMMAVIPTFYKQEQDERKRILRKRYYFPKIRNHFRFFYFGKDANSINKAEDASIYR
ncbi:MAG: hypothetical protein Q4B28_03830 [bacterium]|nr:hypothetical protein [bacterium]